MHSVCVHGLGYVGLPTSAMLANRGHEVVGYDTATTVIGELDRGEIRFDDPELQAFVERALRSGNFQPSREPTQADYHLICVPTPLDEDNRADLRYVEAAGTTIGRHLRAGDTVVLESTVPPETTTDVLRPSLETGELTAGEDFSLAYSPETVLPGNVVHELEHNDRIVGGIDEESAESAVALYDSFVAGEIHTTDATTAEFVKLVQNAFRDVNIAFANEIARRCYEHGIDSRETLDLVNRHPRVDVLNPGPGVGGHCIPTDPYFLPRRPAENSLIGLARRINDRMVDHVIRLLEDLIGDLGGSAVAVLGVSYKGNVADTRASPGLELADRLTSYGSPATSIDVSLADPHVAARSSEVDAGGHRFPLEPVEDAVEGADATVVVTDHDEFRDLDPARLANLHRRANVVDTRSILELDRWRENGFDAVHL